MERINKKSDTTKERYVDWLPIVGAPEYVICEKILDDFSGFSIFLKEHFPGVSGRQGRFLKVMFDAPIAYQCIDESYLIKRFDDHEYRNSAFCIVEDSAWRSWVNVQSYGVYSNEPIKHFSIFTLNQCLDVLSEFEPIVEWVSGVPS